MNNYFHMILDLENFEQQDEIMASVSAIGLKSFCMDFNAFPGGGYFVPVRANLVLFCKRKAARGVVSYRDKQRHLSPEASFICLGDQFHFHQQYEILEIPHGNYQKFLTRCVLNLYLEFNKIPHRSRQKHQ